jgi:fumarate hydratase class I
MACYDFSMQFFESSILELIIQTSTNLPPDVRAAMKQTLRCEQKDTRSGQALSIIAENVDQAAEGEGAICQDTGMPTFMIKTPVGVNQIVMAREIRAAIVEATKRGKLRPNSVDSLTGKNSGNNLGEGTPVLHFEQWEEDDIEVRLILKGGGCENMNAQFSVPIELPHLGRADRDLEGVRRCILAAVWQAQGKGCGPGVVGVCIGGDRTSGYQHAKEQLFRTLDDTNPNAELAAMEGTVIEQANKLGVGAMGFGGVGTLIGCKIGVQNRLPASFFVSVAYECWAFRRLGLRLDAQTGAIKQWLYRDPERPVEKLAAESPFQLTGREVNLETPLTEEKIRALKVGDVVLVSGKVYTGRDAVHKYLAHADLPADMPQDALQGALLYHCGPVMLKQGDHWSVQAAGPTTSIREEPYQADLIRRFGIRAVMGKGGMGAKTAAALKENGAVYLNAIGGAAQFYARCMTRVEGVHMMEFGIPEAMWEIHVQGLPAIVTMDATGASLHAEIEKASGVELDKLVTV